MNRFEIIHGKSWLEKNGYEVENNVVEKIDVDVIGHFGNCVTLKIFCSNIVPYSGINNTRNIGTIIQTLIEVLGESREDGKRLSEIRNVPVRLIFEGSEKGESSNRHWGKRAVGIGNFMMDKYVLFSELSRVECEEMMENKIKNEINKTEKTERIDRAKRTEKAERIACINCGEVFMCEEDKCPKCGVRFVDFWGVEKRGEKVMMRVRTNVIVGEKEAKATVVIMADKMRVKNMTVDRTAYVGKYAGERVGVSVGESMEASVEIEGHLLAGEKGDVVGIVRE